jgi:hypothetical protein
MPGNTHCPPEKLCEICLARRNLVLQDGKAWISRTDVQSRELSSQLCIARTRKLDKLVRDSGGLLYAASLW